ncbi:MAG: alpha/beta fold hydrolase [Chloroflexi bacterium]|nr:alpha/beta fold hydrolase [Chloroflexota bacterium]
MNTQHGFANVNNTRLYYEVAGDGQPLVLIHGFTLDRRMWDHQFEAFAHHYQVVRYDGRGFGRSALPTAEPYDYADDLKALLDYLGIAHAHIIGLSLGGGVAIDFALAYPRMTDTLIPVDSILGGYRWRHEFGDSLRTLYSLHDAQAATALWLNDPLFAPANAQPVVGAKLAEIVNEFSGWHWVNNNPWRQPEPPAIERLAEITAPTLVVIGERDLSDFHAIAGILQERIRGARLAVIPGAGHMANMEAPEAFNKLVLDFLSGRKA